MSPVINAVILALDSTCRMHSKLPKVLHECAGLPMVAYSVRLANTIGAKRIMIMVDGSSRELVESTLQSLFVGWPLEFIQADAEQQAVTGAIAQGLKAIHNELERVVILHGDMPLVQSESVNLVRQHAERTGFAILQARESIHSNGSAGKLRRSAGAGDTEYIVWGSSRLVRERFARHATLQDVLSSVDPQELLESTLTETYQDLYRVSTRVDLSKACRIAQDRLIHRHQESGVCFVDPRRVYLETDVVIDQDVKIGLDVTLHGNTIVSADTIIDGPTFIKDSQIASNVHVHPFCHLESARVARDANVGPFARLRHGTEIGCQVRVGNFVEVKNSTLGSGAKVNHLSYIGDAEVGGGTNIGAGTITCNYDGYNKHRTIVGDDAFIGSNSTLVAPIRLGNGVLVAAGSTVTKSAVNGSLIFGRARQVEREGFAKELRSRLSQSK